jgi:nucleoside-diphosphate-sugar epimerase
MRVVVTGANGFVGKAICTELARRGHSVVVFVRNRKSLVEIPCDDAFFTGPIEQMGVDIGAMRGADAVIHTAGWSGSGKKHATSAYVTAVNVTATAQLADMALRSGVRQFI